MTNKERVLRYLTENKVGLCDDCLSEKTGIRPRQTIYQVCTTLAKEGRIFRKPSRCSVCGKGNKLTNTVNPQGTPPEVPGFKGGKTVSGDQHIGNPWYWEGNIQSALVTHLAKEGYRVTRVSHTISREPGKDIEAITPDGRNLWISVKGWPENSPNTQARHWFSQALFDMILYRDESKDVDLAVAFPDGYQTYRNLANRIRWFKESANFRIYWVSEDGSVQAE